MIRAWSSAVAGRWAVLLVSAGIAGTVHSHDLESPGKPCPACSLSHAPGATVLPLDAGVDLVDVGSAPLGFRIPESGSPRLSHASRAPPEIA